MSFSSDLWNGFDILRKNFLQTYDKIKHFYEMMFSFASLEKNHSKNLEILYEKNKDIFNNDEMLLVPSKTFISSLKVECEYHKYYYHNIFDNILSSLKNIIDNKKYLVTKIFCDSMKNTNKFNKIIQNIISKQEDYYGSCKELSLSISEKEVFAIKSESKKNKSGNKVLNSKIDKAMENVTRKENEYINIITESNVILKDYNLKMDNLLNDLQKEFTQINLCIKECLINYSKNKIQLYKDVLEMANHGLNTCYEKIDVENNIKNFITKNATKEFKYRKFEYIPFKLNNINKNLLFTDIKENDKKLQPKECDRIIQNVKKFFVDNKISGSDSDYIERITNSLKNIKLGLSIKYDLLLDINKSDENKNLIMEFPNKNDINKNTNLSNSKITDKEKEITNNLKLLENFINKLTAGEQGLDNDLTKIKKILEKKENYLYLEDIIKNLNNYRSHGHYILKDKTYDYFLDLFIFILEHYINNDYIVINILNFSQTFYKIIHENKNPKYFIVYNLRNNEIFNKAEIWHKMINYCLTNYTINKDLSNKIDKKDKEQKLEYHIYNILIENLATMKLFNINNKVYDEVKNHYIQIYNIDQEKLDKEIQAFNKGKYFRIIQENENELNKGFDKNIILQNDDEKKENNDSKENKEKSNEKKEENIIQLNNNNQNKEINDNK